MLEASQFWIDYEMIDNSASQAELEGRLWGIFEFYNICALHIATMPSNEFGNLFEWCVIEFIDLFNELSRGDIVSIVEEAIRSCSMIPLEYNWDSCGYPSDFIETVADFYGMSMDEAIDALRKANYI